MMYVLHVIITIHTKEVILTSCIVLRDGSEVGVQATFQINFGEQ